ncbi:lipoprotein-releasing ABC transporter permease subunit LolC [Xenorhabdus szentirmaii]|nr:MULTISPECIES: lipoprotein-releasing ABC transporter permease subunit LolC [Xenorhabdus]MBD2781188.1 lipoprotein-releasing ABC transporter permease subunit LolC [Xenorhabdus sp. 38]MBD2791067.1 lipoprotein-releasing ABC transporter permease subunit LolC [Xenorhabdus sp. CUL]MBD2799807.1 lipoprotein-releasing ABC transporter permease subunit LolC [Xenorhabdus sp. M]MBD2805113.1 lipoprotein-releasing ABC transporter permease subunit LolC [Xenorhabdus sp. ZM]MBD2819153.1 lipoprotein-releasing A
MFQSVSLFIGLRYMRGRAVDKFGRFVSWLSAVGIMLGVAALITVLSVMNGFERSLEGNILGFMPHAVMTSEKGSIDPVEHPSSQLSELKGVNRITSLVEGNVVLQSAQNVGVGMMQGITPTEYSPLSKYIIGADRNQLQPGRYFAILGEKLAIKLGVKRGDQIRVIVPSASQLTPMGRIPSQRLFTVAGTFFANSEADATEMLVNQQDAARLLRYPVGHITGWRLYLNEPLLVDELSQQALPEGLIWKDWRERKGEFFQAVRMEKNMMGLLLSLIIAVAAFNIITSLSLLVMEKQGEIAILQTQGLTRRQVMAIFMIQGAGAGIIGALLGTGLGILLSSQLNSLMPLIGLLTEGIELPVEIDTTQVVTIAISAMLISLLSTLYPSWRAAATQPAEALRYE